MGYNRLKLFKKTTISSVMLITMIAFNLNIAFADSNEIIVKKEFLPTVPLDNYGFDINHWQGNIFSNKDGIFRVKNPEGKWGYMDFNGNVIADYQFDNASVFENGFAIVGYRIPLGENTYSPMETYINTDGKLISEYKNAVLHDYSEDYAVSVSSDNGKYGYINSKNQVVINYQFDKAGDFKNGYAIVVKDGKYGYIDKLGNLVISYEFEDARDFQEERAAVKKDGLWGYIDTKGNLVVNYQFEIVNNYSEGMAKVAYRDRTQQETRQLVYGYIDKSGKLVIDYQYKVASDFLNGVASVSKTNELHGFYINKQNNKIIDKGFNYAGNFSEGYAVVSSDGKYGYINRNGEMVVPYKYDYLTDFSDGKALAKKDGKAYLVEINEDYLMEKQKNKPISIVVNESKITFDSETGHPYLDYSHRTKAPIRAIVEKYGAEVNWDNDNKRVVIRNGKTTVEIPIGMRYLLVDGERQYMDSSATIVQNRTYLPVRAVIEALGGSVKWDAKQNAIIIS